MQAFWLIFFFLKMDDIIKLVQNEDRTAIDPLQVAKASACDEFSSCAAGHFIFQRVGVVTRGTPALDLNLSYKDDNAGEKEMKANLGGMAHNILDPLTARKRSAKSDTDRQNSGEDHTFRKGWFRERDRAEAHG